MTSANSFPSDTTSDHNTIMESLAEVGNASLQPRVQIFLPGDELELSEFQSRGEDDVSRRTTKGYSTTPKRKGRTRSVGSDSGTVGESSNRSKSSRKKPKRIINGPDPNAHLHPLQDYLRPCLDVVFCGINPGCLSAATGHHFANPTNHFWRCLHRSGLTSALVSPSKDYSLPEGFNLGLTNLVERPSTQANELTRAEMIASVPTFFDKLARHRPRFVCFVGVVIWEIVRAALSNSLKQGAAKRTERGKTKEKTQMGLQPYKLVYEDSKETLFFLVPCTSGRVVQYQLPDKIALFTELQTLVKTAQSDIDTSGMETVIWDSSS